MNSSFVGDYLTIDIIVGNSLLFIIKRGGRPNASILCEMPYQERDEGC